jgi:hypothetical protein
MTNQRDMNVVAEVKKRYGHVIDLDKSPNAIIEIIHNFRHLLDENARLDPGQGGGPGGPGARLDPGQGGGPGGPGVARVEEVGTAAVLNLLLELKREVQALHAKIK